MLLKTKLAKRASLLRILTDKTRENEPVEPTNIMRTAQIGHRRSAETSPRVLKRRSQNGPLFLVIT